MVDNTDQQNYNTFQEKLQLPSFTTSNNASNCENHHLLPPSTPSPSRNSIYYRLFVQNRLAVITICYCYAAFGMCVAILGPVLLDLSCLTETTLRTISWLFFFQTFLFSAGSALAGYLVTNNTFADESIMLVSMCLLPVTMILLPLGNSIAVLAVNLSVMGLILGCIENMCNIKMIDLFKDKVAPFLQALHFFYGFGAFLTPFISKPFLSNQDCTLLLKNATRKYRIVNGINFTVSVDSIDEAQDMTQVQWAFAIVAALMLPGIGFVLAYGVHTGRWQLFWLGFRKAEITSTAKTNTTSTGTDKVHPSNSFELDYTTGPGKDPVPQSQNNEPDVHMNFFSSIGIKGKHVVAVTVLAGLVNLVYDGLQASFSDFGYTYAVNTVKHLEGRRSEAAYTESVFWASFALGRLMSIFLAAYFFPAIMIGTQMVTLIFVVIFLLMVETFGTIHLLLFAFFILGLCISSIVPSCLSLAAQFVVLTPTLTTGLIIGASLGEMIFPVIVGTLIDGYGSKSYISFTFLAAISALCLFFALLSVGRKTPKFMTSGQTSLVFWNFRSVASGEEAALTARDLEGGGYYSQLKDDDDE